MNKKQSCVLSVVVFHLIELWRVGGGDHNHNNNNNNARGASDYRVH